jgi:cytochrome c oxidase subunit 4
MEQTGRPGIRSMLLIYVALMVLLISTVVGSFLPIGDLTHTLFAFGISVAKTLLIVLFFMEVYFQRGLVRVFVCAGVVWLSLLFLLSLADFLSRTWRF